MKTEFTASELNFGPKLVRDLVDELQTVREFCGDFFSQQTVINRCRSRSFSAENRTILTSVLRRQYQNLQPCAAVLNNIGKLENPSTFTITAGHQLCILGGPLYLPGKIAQVLSLCRKLNEIQAEFGFVPIFWMASEDHDFEEIRTLNVFGNALSCEPPQKQMAAGRIPAAIAEEICKQSELLFKGDELTRIQEMLDCYRNAKNLTDASRSLFNLLFGQYGLVIIDGDDAELKRLFVPAVKRELADKLIQKNVHRTNDLLISKGFQVQAHAREINLFMISDDGTRERIGAESNHFTCGNKKFSPQDMLNKTELEPSSFSANVLLRPLYQETILPNVAYLGGPGETSYMLQLRKAFEAFELPFPLIRPRDSWFTLSPREFESMQECGLSFNDLLNDFELKLKQIAVRLSEVQLSFPQERQVFEGIWRAILEKVKKIDPTLVAFAESEMTKSLKSIDHLEDKSVRAAKRQNETVFQRIRSIREKLLPEAIPQERTISALQFIATRPGFIERIVSMEWHDAQKIKILQI